MSANQPRVKLLSNNQALRKEVKATFAPTKVAARQVSVKTWPERCDAVVTKAGLNARVERLAARMGCPFVFVLPEADAVLVDYVTDLLTRIPDNEAVVLVGDDIGNQNKIVNVSDQAASQEILL